MEKISMENKTSSVRSDKTLLYHTLLFKMLFSKTFAVFISLWNMVVVLFIARCVFVLSKRVKKIYSRFARLLRLAHCWTLLYFSFFKKYYIVFKICDSAYFMTFHDVRIKYWYHLYDYDSVHTLEILRTFHPRSIRLDVFYILESTVTYTSSFCCPY